MNSFEKWVRSAVVVLVVILSRTIGRNTKYSDRLRNTKWVLCYPTTRFHSWAQSQRRWWSLLLLLLVTKKNISLSLSLSPLTHSSTQTYTHVGSTLTAFPSFILVPLFTFLSKQPIYYSHDHQHHHTFLFHHNKNPPSL